MNITKIREIEKRARQQWVDEEIAKFDKEHMDNKYYVMDMFSYPSGAKLHLGHWFNFGLVDSFARFKKMQGYNVFQPMGFDAFGLPAENYAIKTGTHPKDSTMKNIDFMRKQLMEMGGMFDWSNEVITCQPEYYKWTQWLFGVLYKSGLAYKKEAPANWCPSCKTVLAQEQVINGKCERCENEVYLKKMSQWFLKITDYVEELLTDLATLDWPEKTKAMQRNWIGKSIGATVIFKNEVVGDLPVFTTRPETIFGVTYIVMAPEHALVNKITTNEHREEIMQYITQTEKLTEIERQSTTHEKSGVFTGAYAINPITGKKIPIWISDYVLESYGTGIVMAVPAHDQRDFEFAKKYELDILPVIEGYRPNEGKAYTGSGKLINSDFLDKLDTDKAREAIIKLLEEKNVGKQTISYRLKDWLISRQRYWGTPIPIVYCKKCGEVLVTEDQLPVQLPYDVDFTPTGDSPLATCNSFKNTKCPICGSDAKREVDTMDTFMCSSWYMFRYPDSHNSEKAFDYKLINKMLPVDKYVGGAEHSCMHLIYARFITKVLRDAGYINFGEPFTSLVHQGIILGPDGHKMSKTKGNTVSPDAYISMYGSDVFRTYLMFGFNYFEGGPWSDKGIIAIKRYYDRVDETIENYCKIDKFTDLNDCEEKQLEGLLNSTISKVTKGMNEFQFNTSVARMMELWKAIKRYIDTGRNSNILKMVIEIAIKLMAPEAPHITEYYWQKLGHSNSIFKEKWPIVDDGVIKNKDVEIPVQINSKNIAVIKVKKGATKEFIMNLVSEQVNTRLNGMQIMKVVYVPDRIINYVAK